VPTIDEIISFHEDTPPAGADPFVVPQEVRPIEVVPYQERWADDGARLIARVRTALGPRALRVDHVGSTSVPGLPAKPIIDLDVTVADPEREEKWLPLLESAGFVLTIREPWWQHHRMLKSEGPTANGSPDANAEPAANVHVFGPDSTETVRHLLFRDHLRADEQDRDLYARSKRAAAATATEHGEFVMDYNRRKQEVVREIYRRAFAAAGLLDG
jgi:GrpB-like predicted nucleotidyltransferase (UPF0157 family)